MAPLRKPGKRSADLALLTEAELELMQLIWDQESATVKELLTELPKERRLAYTTVSTICRILEQKGFLKAVREGRSHRYVPKLSKPEYERIHLRHTVGTVFSGQAKTLIRCLVDDGGLSDSDIAELQSLLENSKEARE